MYSFTTNLLLLNLQYFAANDDGGTGSGAEANGNENEQSSAEGGRQTEAGVIDDNAGGNTKNTFTQENVNDIVARETRKAQEDLLKKLGVKDFKSAKQGLEKLKEIQDEQMTESEKLAKRANDLEKENANLTSERETLKATLEALKKGVNPEYADDVVVLANRQVSDDVEIEQAITSVLEKYPHFKLAQQADDEGKDDDKRKPPKFSNSEHKDDSKKTTKELWADAFKF